MSHHLPLPKYHPPTQPIYSSRRGPTQYPLYPHYEVREPPSCVATRTVTSARTLIPSVIQQTNKLEMLFNAVDWPWGHEV